MADLLHVHLRTIWKVALVRFTEDWVERLIEDVARVVVGQGIGDHELHSFDWVMRESSRC